MTKIHPKPNEITEIPRKPKNDGNTPKTYKMTKIPDRPRMYWPL